MPEFLDVIETIRAEEASVQRLFGGEGVGVRGRQKSPQYLHKLAEAAKLVGEVYQGKRPAYHLREAMTTSDFPQLFGDILDRQLLANYREAPYSWNLYTRRATVRDFRTVKRFTLEGSEGVLPEVLQSQEYTSSSLSDGQYTYAVKKYGRKLPISWETLINDDLNAFRDIPERYGRASRRSEEKFVTQLHVDANGPHASLYTVGNANKVTGNPVLSTTALQTAMTILSQQVDSDGEPIMVDAMVLEVPPALEIVAYNIVNALQLELNENGGSTNTKLIAPNWMRNRVKVAVNYYIPIVASTANGNTSWFLHADPSNGRPALEMGFLQGHEEPEIFVKAPNAQRIGGGTVLEDFDSDAIEYKVRHVFGGSRMDPKMTVASNGSGS
jgi:hypothetical protein